jgi:hypothetical protein
LKDLRGFATGFSRDDEKASGVNGGNGRWSDVSIYFSTGGFAFVLIPFEFSGELLATLFTLDLSTMDLKTLLLALR